MSTNYEQQYAVNDIGLPDEAKVATVKWTMIVIVELCALLEVRENYCTFAQEYFTCTTCSSVDGVQQSFGVCLSYLRKDNNF